MLMNPTVLDELSRELSILSRAVSFQNLSVASQNIGMSQPQLSRVLAKLEKRLGVLLLNREIKRRSSWTTLATELAQTFSRSSRSLDSEIQRLITKSPLKRLRMGTLEGLIPRAAEIGHQLFAQLNLEMLELESHDLQELEDRFLRGELDLILTMREPGRRKYPFYKVLGYQALQEIRKSPKKFDVRIESAFEFQSRSGKTRKKSSKDLSNLNQQFTRSPKILDGILRGKRSFSFRSSKPKLRRAI